MKPTLFLSMIIAMSLTLTACDDNANNDKVDAISTQLEEAGAEISESASDVSEEVTKMSQTAQENTSDAAEIIKINVESIEENIESNPRNTIFSLNFVGIKYLLIFTRSRLQISSDRFMK